MDGYGYYFATALQDHGMGQDPFIQPTDFYIALSKESTTPTGVGLDEPVGGLYAREHTVPADWNPARGWPGYTDALIDNKNDIEYERTTAAWGTIKAFLVVDEPVAPSYNVFWGGDLVAPKAIEIDTIAVFQAGDLSISSINTPAP